MDAVVTLLGSLAARDLARPHSPTIQRFRTRKTASLLAFLAFHAGAPQSRERLIESLWAETDLDAGRMSLRTALSALRKDFGDALHADRTTVTLHARTDLQQFEGALQGIRLEAALSAEQAERLREAVELYGGPLLPYLYDDWVLPERDRLAAVQQAALAALVRWHEALDELPAALVYAHRAAAAEPLSETARGALIHLLKRMGRHDEARRQFDEMERLLHEQLGIEPSAPLRDLVAGIAPRPESPGPSAPVVRLPVSRGRFRGRQELLAQLVQRFSGGKNDAEGARLFTLVGPGGIGKTRLAIEAARRLAAHGLVDEVWFVPLVTAVDEDQVWEGVLQALELPTTPHRLARIAARLSESRTGLLVLDNLEQASLEAGEAARLLLERVPGLTILATSRRRLGVPGEAPVMVGPLREDDAVGLFVDRARSVVPEFAPGEEAATIQRLTRRLESFPLAIELAATWIGALSPAEMLAQLDAGSLSMARRAGGAGRHDSLQATLDWSMSLQSPDLRRAFRSLSIFRGGWDAAAASSVCRVGRDALAILRDRSLILARTGEGTIRFDLFETFHQYGRSALSADERGELSTRHIEYFTALAESGADSLRGELANLRAALAAADPPQHLRLTRALTSLWEKQGLWREARAEQERALADLPADTDPSIRAELLYQLGKTCYNLTDYPAARLHHEAGLALCQALGDDRGCGRALHALASLSFHYQPDLARARELTWQALLHSERAGHAPGQTAALIGLGVLATAVGELIEARAFQRRSLEIAEAAGLESEQGVAHWRLGMTAGLLKEYDEADAQLARAERIFEALDEPIRQAYVRAEQGALAQNREPADPDKARRLYEEALPLFREVGELWACAICLGNLARIATAAGDWDRAAGQWGESLRLRALLDDDVSLVAGLNGVAGLLFGMAAARDDLDLGRVAVRLRSASAARAAALELGPPGAEDLPEHEPAIRTALGEAECARAEREGATWTTAEATAHARATLASSAGGR